MYYYKHPKNILEGSFDTQWRAQQDLYKTISKYRPGLSAKIKIIHYTSIIVTGKQGNRIPFV